MGLSSSKAVYSDMRAHWEAENQLKEAKSRQETQVKVLLLGSGDSGKSTMLKQMRLIHKVGFTPEEIESYRRLVFANIINGMRLVLESMPDFDLSVEEHNQAYPPMIESAPDLDDEEPFPVEYRTPLESLWNDAGVQKALLRGNEVALPVNLKYFFPELDRFFEPSYKPVDQDVLHCRARTTGITETVFKLRTHELHLLDVGGQKGERRKWIHCFENVTSILFLASLNGYDMCLTEDHEANQMQDAMAIWDSTCHSPWFKTTSIILFLNKLDLFTEKVQHSDIKAFFPDYEGKPKDVTEGREYFRRRFLRLAQKSSRTREREIYVHFTNATDTALLRVVMAAVEEYVLFLFKLTPTSRPPSSQYAIPLFHSFHNLFQHHPPGYFTQHRADVMLVYPFHAIPHYPSTFNM